MKKKYVILILLALLSVITFLDRNAISLAGKRITDELGLSASQFGWVLFAFTLSYGVLEIPSGWLGDRFGARKVLARIVLAWSAFTALTGLATGFLSLFTTRFLFGAGESGAYPNTAVAIRRWFPEAELGRAQSVIWMASRLGGALAPLIIIPLQISFGWRTAFFVLGGIGILWAVAWLWTYRASEEVAMEVQAKRVEGITLVSFLRNGNFWLLMLMYYCYATGVFFFISWLPRYLQQGRGMAEGELMFSASLPFFLAAFGCLAGGVLSDWCVARWGVRTGRRVVPMVGLALAGIFLFGAAFVGSNAVAVVLLALGLALMDVTAPVAWAVATDFGGRSSGVVTGAMNSAGLLAGSVSAVATGYVIEHTGDYQVVVVITAVVLLTGSQLWWLIRPDALRTR